MRTLNSWLTIGIQCWMDILSANFVQLLSSGGCRSWPPPLLDPLPPCWYTKLFINIAHHFFFKKTIYISNNKVGKEGEGLPSIKRGNCCKLCHVINYVMWLNPPTTKQTPCWVWNPVRCTQHRIYLFVSDAGMYFHVIYYKSNFTYMYISWSRFWGKYVNLQAWLSWISSWIQLSFWKKNILCSCF